MLIFYAQKIFFIYTYMDKKISIFYAQKFSLFTPIADFIGLPYFSGFPSGLKSHVLTRGDQKVRGKVLLYHSAFINCNENSQIETTLHSKLTEIEI